MDISVIIPSYAPREYLWECLDSVYNQTFEKTRFEVFIVLNGCNEPYRSQISEWQEQHPLLNLKIIQTDAKGASNARNLGLDNASGEYICFIDDDDYVSPEYLQSLYDSAAGSSIVVSDAIAFDDKNCIQIEDYKPHTKYEELIGKKVNLINGRIFLRVDCRKLILRDIIGSRRFKKRLYLGEDSVFMFLISDRIDSIVLASPDAVYYRRVRPDSVFYQKRSLGQEFLERMKLIREYTTIYFSSPKSYSFLFFVTRLLASIKSIILHVV